MQQILASTSGSLGDAGTLDRYNARFPAGPQFSAGSGSTGIYRGLKLWEPAVNEAGSLDRSAVVVALDHATIAEAPAGRPRWCLASTTFA